MLSQTKKGFRHEHWAEVLAPMPRHKECPEKVVGTAYPAFYSTVTGQDLPSLAFRIPAKKLKLSLNVQKRRGGDSEHQLASGEGNGIPPGEKSS